VARIGASTVPPRRDCPPTDGRGWGQVTFSRLDGEGGRLCGRGPEQRDSGVVRRGRWHRKRRLIRVSILKAAGLARMIIAHRRTMERSALKAVSGRNARSPSRALAAPAGQVVAPKRASRGRSMLMERPALSRPRCRNGGRSSRQARACVFAGLTLRDGNRHLFLRARDPARGPYIC